MLVSKDSFLKIIRNTFSENLQNEIDFDTDLHNQSEWSSLHAMIVVSEIDKAYDIILTADDIRYAKTVGQLFERVSDRLK